MFKTKSYSQLAVGAVEGFGFIFGLLVGIYQTTKLLETGHAGFRKQSGLLVSLITGSSLKIQALWFT